MNLRDLPEPLNANERLMHHMIVRQNIMIEQLSSIVEHLASKDKVAMTSNKSVEKEAKPEPAKKEVKEDAPAPKKRAPRKKKEE